MVQIPTMQQLLEAGVHFGHQTRKWHPKMAQFIFAPKDGVHIIDLEKTVDKLGLAAKFLAKIASEGGKILFVGTKRQAQEIVAEVAKKTGDFFITERWIGGLLTNFSEIQKNIQKLKDLQDQKASDDFLELTKKERLLVDREIAKLNRFYGGIREMDEVPAAVVIVDVKKEETACREAKRKGIPVVAICDTNANLALVDYPIPGNDDAIKSIKIILKTVADAIIEGRKGKVIEPEVAKEPKVTEGAGESKESKRPEVTKEATARKPDKEVTKKSQVKEKTVKKSTKKESQK